MVNIESVQRETILSAQTLCLPLLISYFLKNYDLRNQRKGTTLFAGIEKRIQRKHVTDRTLVLSLVYFV